MSAASKIYEAFRHKAQSQFKNSEIFEKSSQKIKANSEFEAVNAKEFQSA